MHYVLLHIDLQLSALHNTYYDSARSMKGIIVREVALIKVVFLQSHSSHCTKPCVMFGKLKKTGKHD